MLWDWIYFHGLLKGRNNPTRRNLQVQSHPSLELNNIHWERGGASECLHPSPCGQRRGTEDMPPPCFVGILQGLKQSQACSDLCFCICKNQRARCPPAERQERLGKEKWSETLGWVLVLCKLKLESFNHFVNNVTHVGLVKYYWLL